MRKLAATSPSTGCHSKKATEVFSDPKLATINAMRKDDGEARLKPIGRIGGRFYTGVYARRGAVRRLISARWANAKEERSYGDRSQHV